MNKDYFVFVLGYDLMHNLLNNIECDVAFEICSEVYDEFLLSKENTPDKSEYECLSNYIRNHQEEIKCKTEKYI